MSKQKSALAGSSGVNGGYLTVPDPAQNAGMTAGQNTNPQTSETQLSDPKAQLKEAIAGALQPHLGSGQDDLAAGHIIHMHPETGAVHHSHPADIDAQKLVSIKSALEGVPGVSSVTQESEKSVPPEGGGWEHAFGIKGMDEMEANRPAKEDGESPNAGVPADQTNADQTLALDPDETKKVVAAVKAMTPAMLTQYVTSLKAKTAGKLDSCVQHKIPKIAGDHPEMSDDQRVAVAYSMCGEKAMTKDLNNAPPGGANPTEDGTDENLPHGVGHAKATLAHHNKAFGKMHPNDGEFYKAMCGLVKEHAESEYPEHADHFKDFGDDGANGESAPATGQADGTPKFGDEDGDEDDQDGAAKTAAAVAPYKSYKTIAVKRWERKLGSRALKLLEDAAQQFKELSKLKAGDKWTVAQNLAVQSLAKQCQGAVVTFGQGAKLDAINTDAKEPAGSEFLKTFSDGLGEDLKKLLYPVTGKREHKPASPTTGFESAKK